MENEGLETSAEGERRLEPSPRFVRFSIFLASLLFFTAAAVIGWRWFNTNPPSMELIIDGSNNLDGAEVEVESADEPMHAKAVFGEGERYSLPFYVEPGAYTIKVTRNGEELMEPREVTLKPLAGAIYRIDLTKWEPKLAVTRPATQSHEHEQ